jgi:hypothetical protein
LRVIFHAEEVTCHQRGDKDCILATTPLKRMIYTHDYSLLLRNTKNINEKLKKPNGKYIRWNKDKENELFPLDYNAFAYN